MNDKKITSRVVRAAPPNNTPQKKHPSPDEKTLKQELKQQAAELRQVRLELKRLQDEFRLADKAREQKQLIIESAGTISDGPLFSVDRRYCYTSFNAQHAQIMKSLFNAEIELGHNLLDYHTNPADRRNAKKNLDRAFKGETVQIESAAGEEAKSRRVFEIMHAPIRDKTSKVIGATVQARDISEHKLTQAALEESKLTYSAIFENSPLAISLTKMPEGCLLNANKAFLKLFEFTQEELPGKTWVDLGITERGWREQVFAELAAHGTVRDLECVRTTRSGEKRNLSFDLDWVTIAGEKHILTTVRDISAHKHTEEALVTSRKQLQSIIDNSPSLIYAVDLEKRFLVANRATAETVNSTTQQMIGKLRQKFMPRKTAQGHEANDRKVIETGGSLEFEESGSFGGRVITYLTTKFPLFDDKGSIYAVAGISTDISERKKAEAENQHLMVAVQKEKDRLAILVNNVSDEIWFAEASRKFTLANPVALEKFGIAPDNPVAIEKFAASLEVFQPDGSPRPIDEAPPLRALRGESVNNLEEIVRIPASGQLRYREVNASTVRDAKGEITGAVCVVRDVTDRKQAEDAIRQSEARFRNLVELSPDAVFVNRNNRIVLANRAMLELFGATRPDQILGKTPFDLFHPDYHAQIRERMERTHSGQEVPTVEEKIVRLDGTTRVVEVSPANIIDEAGQATQVILRDVTERIERENNLQRLNRTLKALSDINQAMLRKSNEAEFMVEVCRVVVEDCGHAMVWIGLAEQDKGKTVRPVASAGFEEGYLDTLKITWADTERGRGPTGSAIRTGRVSMCRNMLTDPQFKPWRAQALKRGYASSIVLPLMSGSQAFGALTIYSREPDPFSENEVALLSELAGDLTFGIEAFRRRAAHAQTEQALQESEERFRQLADAAFEGLVIHADGVILDVNKRLIDMLGHDPAALIDRPFWNFIDAKYHQLVREKVSTGFTGGYEIELIHKDGRRVPVEVTGRPLMWKGQPTRVGSLRDISERRLAEQELRKSEARYRALFNGMTEGFALHEIICDEKGQPVDYRFLDINPAFERLTGLKRAEVVGRTHNEVLPEDSPIWVESYGKVALTGEPLSFDNYSAALQRHYEVFAYQPMPGQFAVIFLDVTVNKLAEQALHKSEEKARNQAAELETIFATLADSVIVYGPDAVAIRANDSAKVLLGFDPTGAGLKKNMTSAGTRSETRLSATARALQGEVVRDAEFDFDSPRGERRTVSASSSPLRDAQGHIIGAVTVSRDISERKKQQEVVEWLASFPKQNPSPVVEIDFNRTVSYLNPAAERIFPGLQADGWQHPFLSDLEAILDDFRSGGALTTARDIKVGESFYRQTISYLPDSRKLRIYSIDITGRVKAEAALRQARDELDLRVSERTQELLSANKLLQKEIVERLRAEGAMKESERRYRTLFESSPDTVMLIDLDQKILFANKQAASMHGYRQTKKLVGMQFTDLVAPDDRDVVHQTISKTSEAGALRDIEYQIQMKDGAHYPAELNVTTICNDQDRPIGFLLDIRDIIERKRAEESLRQANAYNRSLIEASLDPLVTITPQGKIGDVNQATEKVTGFAREELIGTDFHTYFSNPEMARTGYQQAFETGNVRSYELEIRHKDGHLTPVLYNASTYRDESGKVLGVFAVARDISDRKNFETQLVQAEKHAVVGRMVGSITHEINNPLQTIKNCLYLMQQDVPADSPIHEPLEMVTSETRRLTTLVGQLRELYRPKVAVEKHPEELLDILEEAHALLIPHMNNAQVEWHPLTGLQRCYVNCMRDQVLEVFLNISMNAIQSMQSHGGTLFVDMDITDEWVGVIFKDTGPGIPKEMMLHLFEPFMTTKASGLGLGLSITYGIVQRHGGQIQVDNQPGAGATFTVLLPLHDHDGDEEESKHGNK